MKRLVSGLVGVLAVMCVALSPAAGNQGDNDELPIGLTQEEMTRLNEIGITHISTAPPPGPLRACAEWERSQGVIIRWPLGISVALIAEMSRDIVVTTIVGSESQRTQAISAYTAGGVTMAHTEFMIAPTNSYWTRDYGPWFIFDGLDQLAIVDHIYNRPRPDDDQIPGRLGLFWGMSVYGMDLVHTGGNHMTDGLGRSMSTDLVYDENPGLAAYQVDSIMLAYLGNDYIVLDDVESGGIHHIDCWAKLLNPATILVKDVAAGDPAHNPLDARAAYLSQLTSPWGRPYSVIRVFCPSGTAYTNSLILNNKVFVPTFGSSSDTTALRVYREAMPGYQVLGFSGSWLDDDAIHCRAMGMPDRGLLYIRHTPLATTGDTLNGYPVAVRIRTYSGEPLISDSLKLFYRGKSGQYQSLPLLPTAVPDSFQGFIPAQTAGTEISYYLKAADNSGRVETDPLIGQAWAYSFYINRPPDVTSPDTFTLAAGTHFDYFPQYSDSDDSVISLGYSGYPEWLTVQNDTLTGTIPDTTAVFTLVVHVSDPYSTTQQEVTFVIYRCGDADGVQAINVADAVYLVNYVFKGGSAPEPIEAGDANCDGTVNLADAVYLVNYVFKGGPEPCCP